MITGLALRPTTPDFGAVGRSLLGVLAVAALGLQWGSVGAATAAAGAAAIAGATALQDSPRRRIPLVVAVSVATGAAVFLGQSASAHSIVFVGVVAVWCFAAGMAWALSANAGLIAAAASALLVTAPPAAPSFSSVAIATALVVAGGLTQAALIGIWPQRRWRVQREALARAYGSLGAYAASLATDPEAHIDPDPLIRLRRAFTLTESQARRRPPVYRGWYGLPERISVTVSAFGRQADAGDARSGSLSAAGEVLGLIAGANTLIRGDVASALRRADAAVAEVSGPEAAVAQHLLQELHEAAALRFSRDPMWALRARLGAVRGHLTWNSPVLRHAVRVAAAAAVGTAVARFAGLEYGYWIAMTALMVLRPETAHTYTRCAGRIAATAAGIVVASTVTIVWHPTGLVAAMLAVACLALAYAVSGFGYLALTAALAAAIVFLIDIDSATDVATMEGRLIATAIGGALAVIAHVVLPDHVLIRLRQRAGELLKTEIEYAAMVVTAFVHQLDHPADALSAAWQRAFRARAAFEAATGATRVDSRELRVWLRSYRTALNAVTSACTSLEKSLPAQPPTALSREFVAAVDHYVDALRGAPPTPASPWSVDIAELTAANHLVREAAAQLAADSGAARVLVAEVATITRSLSGIAEYT